MTAILGVAAFCPDAAAALLVDGRMVAAALEERLSREPQDDAFPIRAIDFCLAEAGLDAAQLDFVAVQHKPLLAFDRLLESYLADVPRGFSSFLETIPLWLKKKIHLPREVRSALGGAYQKRLVFAEQHESLAASAFFPSPFAEAAILTLDADGEWATATVGVGRGNRIELRREQRHPHSIGLVYEAFRSYCGLTGDGGPLELADLAPYGEPRYAARIRDQLMDLEPDGSLRLDTSYFERRHGQTTTAARFDELFGGPPRAPGAPLTQREMDLAASLQQVLEEVVLRSARFAHQLTGMKNLCLAGGSVLHGATGRVLREGPFERVWIQPAAGNAAAAIGVAALVWFQLLDNPRSADAAARHGGTLLGPGCDDDQVRRLLEVRRTPYEHIADDAALCERIAAELDAGMVVGWVQGRMELAPHALGARSILADPRRADMAAIVEHKVNFVAGVRPFPAAVLAEHAGGYFDAMGRDGGTDVTLQTTVRAGRRRPVAADAAAGLDRLRLARSEIPAVTHVDHSARVQAVGRQGGMLRTLLEAFHRRTGCPVLLQASFAVAREPLVCSPEDALAAFMGCELDVLCMGHFVVSKARQPAYVAAVGPAQPDPVLDGLVASPIGGGALMLAGNRARCVASGTEFEREDGIWKLFWPHQGIDDAADVTRVVRAFYEDTPFPNYDDFDSLRSLLDKSRAGIYTRALSRAIPANSTVLEVGCGTGQLTNFLGISCRRVIGTDLCLNSLRLGERFRRAQGLARVRFVQMNLFRPCFAAQQFDVILCNGVLHHTADPFAGYASLLPLLKPGGYVVLGLYNRAGRLMTDLRRMVFRLTGGRARWIDPMLRKVLRAEGKRRAWFADQYRHPHESKHTIGEVLRWFDQTGVDFVRGVPAVTPMADALDEVDLFAPRPRGTAIEHVVVQAAQIFGAGQKEGGLFVMIGRKPQPQVGAADMERRAAGASG